MISLLCGMLALNALLRHYQAQLRPLSLVLLTAGAWGAAVCADDLRTAFYGAAAHQKAVQAGQPSALCAMDRPCGCGIPAGDFPGSSAIMREMR